MQANERVTCFVCVFPFRFVYLIIKICIHIYTTCVDTFEMVVGFESMNIHNGKVCFCPWVIEILTELQ